MNFHVVPMRTPDEHVGATGDVLATVRSYDDLVDAFRTAKDHLGLSNRICDELAGMVEGHTDKFLGPTGARGLTRMAISRFCTIFAIKFEMKIDEVQAERMQGRWEARDASNVRIGGPRLGSAVLERAKPLVLQDFGAELALALEPALQSCGLKLVPIEAETAPPVAVDAATIAPQVNQIPQTKRHVEGKYA